MYTKGYKKRYHPIFASFMIDHKKQVLIIGIKTNIQYLICHILPKKQELLFQL